MSTYKSTIKSQTPKILKLLKYIIFLKKHKNSKKNNFSLTSNQKNLTTNYTINGISYFAYKIGRDLKKLTRALGNGTVIHCWQKFSQIMEENIWMGIKNLKNIPTLGSKIPLIVTCPKKGSYQFGENDIISCGLGGQFTSKESLSGRKTAGSLSWQMSTPVIALLWLHDFNLLVACPQTDWTELNHHQNIDISFPIPNSHELIPE